MTLQETLKAFAAKTRSDNDVMRAIMNHAEWHAPVLYARDVFQTDMFDRIAVWGNEPLTPSNGRLWLFSDDAAGHTFVNKGHHAGPFATGLRGWQLFKGLPDALTGVEINPGSPASEGWYIQPEGFPLTRLWAKAAELEHYMTAGGQQLIEAMVNFPAYTVLITSNGAIATAVGAAGMKNPGMIFTTPDCADVVEREAGPNANLRRVYASGRDLFVKYGKLGVDGLLINPRGPGVAKAFDQGVCEAFVNWIELEAGALAAEAEAKRLEGA